jgi:hypothetical protein
VAPAAMAAHNGRGRRRPLRRGSTEGVVRFVRDKRRDKVPHLAAILRAKRTTTEKQRRGRSMPAGAPAATWLGGEEGRTWGKERGHR